MTTRRLVVLAWETSLYLIVIPRSGLWCRWVGRRCIGGGMDEETRGGMVMVVVVAVMVRGGGGVAMIVLEGG